MAIKDEVGERKHKQWGATDRARLVLYGNIERFPQDGDLAKQAERAFVKMHPDSKAYIPPHGAS